MEIKNYETIDDLMVKHPNLMRAVMLLISGIQEKKDSYTLLHDWDEARKSDRINPGRSAEFEEFIDDIIEDSWNYREFGNEEIRECIASRIAKRDEKSAKEIAELKEWQKEATSLIMLITESAREYFKTYRVYKTGGESTITVIDPLIERAFKEMIKKSEKNL